MKKSTVMNTLRKKIREHKYKFTSQRQVILQAFLDSKEKHLSAEDLYAMVRDENPDIGLATVYRYELNDHSLNHSHYHLICLGCGKVIEFSHELFLSDVKDKIQKDSGFHVVDYQLKFYGYCKDCAKKERDE